MIPAMLFSAGIGVGLVLIADGLWPRPAPLGAVLEALRQPGRPAVLPAEPRPSWADRFGQGALQLARTVGVGLGVSGPDLNIVGRSRQAHAARKAAGVLAGAAGPWVLTAVLVAVAAASPPTGVVAVFSAAGAAGGWLLPDAVLRAAAADRRRSFRHALSAYLDLTNVIAAGGATPGGALKEAAEAGGGWVFTTLRRRLARGQLAGISEWDVFDELGEELGVDELCELAGAVRLAGSKGAQIRKTLASRGDTLRDRQLAATEASAESATQRMVLPMGLMVLGFILFIAYPAVFNVTAAAGGTPTP